MPTRTSQTTWKGSLEEGSGQVELSSSKAGTFDVSFPKRAADEAGGTTSPEELIAAAHSSCFAMQFSALLGGEGATINALNVSADVSLGPEEGGGFKLTGIVLNVSGDVDGVDKDAVVQAAEEAKSTCPVSKALSGVQISLKTDF